MNNHPNVNDFVEPSTEFCATRDDKAPRFVTKAFQNEQIIDVKLDDYKGKWVLLFFYPSDFTVV